MTNLIILSDLSEKTPGYLSSNSILYAWGSRDIRQQVIVNLLHTYIHTSRLHQIHTLKEPSIHIIVSLYQIPLGFTLWASTYVFTLIIVM